MIEEVPSADARVLSTLYEDGSRRWMHPRVSPGRYLRARRILAYVLIAIFTLVPYIRFGDRPLVLLNIPAREFTLLGFTFLPTDTVLLALVLVTGIVGVCLATALFGRVWCGWMCPQTVYTEFVYRPIERLLDGPPGRNHAPGRRGNPVRTAIKYALYLVISAYLAHTFLAYFVGVENLAQWVRRSPFEHPVSFLVMAAFTGLMMFDFSFFREQTCIVACPYGRFQSVMLDRNSLIVSYDEKRGEPRGKAKGRESSNSVRGDCIACRSCVDTCPTGIDIRDGLQMECIACVQCVDACDTVMTRIGKPTGLIRISSQARMENGSGRLLRPRVVIYPVIMLVLVTAFVTVLLNKQTADVTLLRGLGQPFSELTPGQVTNPIRVKIKNRSDADSAYLIEILGDIGATITEIENPMPVAQGESRTEGLLITVPGELFVDGKYDIHLAISSPDGFREESTYRLLGPYGGSAASQDAVAEEAGNE